MTYTSEQITALIAEARAVAGNGYGESCDALRRVAGALEAEHQYRLDWASGGADSWAAYYNKQIDEARAERDALRATIQEIAALHYETDNTLHTTPAKVCAHRYCVDDAGDQVAWPCPTGRILSRAIDTKEEKP